MMAIQPEASSRAQFQVNAAIPDRFESSGGNIASLIGNSSMSKPFNYLVVILLENRNYADIIGNPSAPFLNRLIVNQALASNYHYVSTNLSLPNYLGIISGNTYDSWSGCNVLPSGCPGYHSVPDMTIVNEIESAGMTWKAYMENMPTNCDQNNYGSYAVWHDPFVYFSRITTSSAECNRVVPAGTNATNLISDLSSVLSASNFMWLTPNLCNDMHSCSTLTGDSYLSEIIPRILGSAVFRTQKAALFVTWDEGEDGSLDHVPAIWAGPTTKHGFTSGVRYDHYSFLRTIEVAWNLRPLTPNDSRASTMTEFFTAPWTNFSYVPSQPQVNQTIFFNATATGGFPPYNFLWSYGDGEESVGANSTHQYETAGPYEVTLASADTLNDTTMSTATVIVASEIIITTPGQPKTPTSEPKTTRLTNQPNLAEWMTTRTPMGILIASTVFTFLIGELALRHRKDRNGQEEP